MITTQTEYIRVLELIDTLIDKDPVEGCPDANELELLTKLAQKYEEQHL